MLGRHPFLVRCLGSLDLYTSIAIRELRHHSVIQAEETCLYDHSAQALGQLTALGQDLKTLTAYKRLILTAMNSLLESAAILPAMAPLFLLICQQLPVSDTRTMGFISESVLQHLLWDKDIAKAYNNAVTDFLLDKYEHEQPSVMTSVYLKNERLNINEKLKRIETVLFTYLLQNNRKLITLISDDLQLLRMQMGRALTNPLHRYGQSLKYPVSKTQTLADWIDAYPEPITCLRMSLILPWLEEQISQTCKLHAFYAAAWVLHLISPLNTPCPPPIHALPSMPAEKKSLLEQAQKLFGSKIGEIYSPAHLMNLAKENGFNNVGYYPCDADGYLPRLRRVIDAGGLALIYFDVNVDPNSEGNGYPTQKKSAYEHSGVVCGYVRTESGREYFHVYQWENYYIFTADELLKSSGQLQRRSGELFYDMSTEKEPSWIEMQRTREYHPELLRLVEQGHYRAKLFAPAPPKNLPTFQYCIIAMGPNLECKVSDRPGKRNA